MTHCRGNMATTEAVSMRVMKGEWTVGSTEGSRMS